MNGALSRRAFLLATAASGCTRCEGAPVASRPVHEVPNPPIVPPRPEDAAPIVAAAPDAAAPRGRVQMETWTFPGGGRAVTIVPTWGDRPERLPLLLALHGRGEANKGPVAGVMGWPRDYALLRAIERVCNPPLTSEDFEGFVDPARLAEHNADLAEKPFRGLVIVCPYSPDVDLRKPPAIRAYADYVCHDVLARAKKELPVLDRASGTGIDGVSLGGALALRIGLMNPELFGVVGSLQAAIGEDQVPEFLELARSAKAKRPSLKLRFLTSTDDYFRSAITHLSGACTAAGIAHDYALVPGPHDYPFNRGPGAIEMLLFHDRELS